LVALLAVVHLVVAQRVEILLVGAQLAAPKAVDVHLAVER
jgi:hypothetical protein